jgi:hypothetical protein
MPDHTQEQINELFHKLDRLTESVNCLSTRIERHLARQEAIGDPGMSAGCIRHDERLDEIEESIADFKDSLSVRISDLERTKIRFLGMKDGAGAVLALFGGLLGAAATVFGQWLWSMISGRMP